MDYAGPVMGNMFLVLIDAYSKWLEVRVVSSATSNATIQHLRSIFSTHGLPEVLVSDRAVVGPTAPVRQSTRNRRPPDYLGHRVGT